MLSADAPVFTHPEINLLYKNGLRIEVAALETILSLPRLTLVADLELILQDTRQRYRYYETLFKDENRDDFQDAALHAIMLLGEIKATEAMPVILEWLSESNEFLEFWLGDHIIETIWEPLYKLLPNDTGLLSAFLKNRTIDTYAKSALTQALNQLALQQLQHRSIVMLLYAQVLEDYLLHPGAEDEDFISILAGEAIEIKAKELIPAITSLHDANLLDEFMAGQKEQVTLDMEKADEEIYIKEVLPVAERYREIITTWDSYTDNTEDQDAYNDAGFAGENESGDVADWEPWDDVIEEPEQELLPIHTQPKTGRNDPCPCGSGKKYKKCCMNK